MKKLLLLLFTLGSFQVTGSTDDLWVYFDLGNTVIDLKEKVRFKYIPGAREYLRTLKDMGFKVGAISNIPETFGRDYDEKLKTLQNFVASKWVEDKAFDWEVFDEIYLPLNNSELKPAPALYLRALEENGQSKSLFISETLKEVEAAESHGYAGFLHIDESENLYLPLDEVESFILQNSTIGE